ncbi:MAG: FGGY-family carbohydrate kinase, partial [Caldilineaceae bacterium]|nr:FGGY-family carbohydrate kinase [Caldilineaceae bacterium]
MSKPRRMKSELVLAVDVGSTWCKAAYLNRQGQVVAGGRSFTRDIVPDRNTTLPAFWNAFQRSVHAATANLPNASAPAAIGISSRALFGVCQNGAGEWSLPAWDAQLDRRTSPLMQWAYSTAVWGENDPFAHGYGVAAGALIQWLKQMSPAEWRAIERLGALHDYLLYQLTGAWVTNPTTGPGATGWPPEIIAMTELPSHVFPPVHALHQPAGGLTFAAGQALGLLPGTPVVVGTHDGAAANLGVGAIRPGDACFTFGTNLVLRVVTGSGPYPKTWGYVVVPDAWCWVGNVPNALAQLDIVTQTLCPHLPDLIACHRALGELPDALVPGAAGLVLPLLPTATPKEIQQRVVEARQRGYNDGTIYRAMLEAVAHGVHALVQRATRETIVPQRFVTTGGHSQNRLFMQILAAVLDRPLEIGPVEGGLLGAGMAAAVGVGWYADFADAVRGMRVRGVVITPD